MDPDEVCRTAKQQLRRAGCTCAVQIMVRRTDCATGLSIKHESKCALYLKQQARWN